MNPPKKQRKITQDDAEMAAGILEATGDYKVLRRMTSWPMGVPKPANGLAKVVLLDTESTGLDPYSDKLIEIGMIQRYVNVETGEFVGEAQAKSWLEDPCFPLQPFTVALTGLTDADVKGQKFNEAEIGAFLSGAALVIAHSAWHDRVFFEARFPRLNDFAWGCSLSQVDWKEAGIGSSKLEYLLFKAGMFHDAHRALPDCQALGHILERHKLPSGITVLQHLIETSLKPDFKIHAVGAPFEQKDVLKAAGYYWDGESKVWHRTITEDHLDEEMLFLHRDIYMGKSARVRLFIITARGRFSDNPPVGAIRDELRSIGPQGDGPAATTGRAGRFAGAGRY